MTLVMLEVFFNFDINLIVLIHLQELRGVGCECFVMGYAAYHDIFPIWALAEYRHHVLQS